MADVTLLLGGVALGLWLLAAQTAFVSRSGSVTDAEFTLDGEYGQVTVDEPTPVRLRADLASALPFDLTATPDLPANVTRSRAPAVTLPSGDRAAETVFELTTPVVGPKQIGPVEVEFRDRGGFFTGTTTDSTTLTVDVQPRTPERVHVGEGGRPLATLYGDHRTDRAGAGLEPYEVREYAPGDQLSRIDWKATARLDHPHIREYELTRSHETALVVDHRASMGDGPPGETKLDHLREVALGFGAAAADFDDPLGLYAVGDDGATASRDPAAGAEGYATIRRLVRRLEPTEASDPDGADPISPTEARSTAERLGGDDSRFGSTLGPYFEAGETYVRRLRDRPLFRTVQLAHSRLRGGSWLVLLTDDSNPTELREAVKLARRNEQNVVVFLAPSVLYESEVGDPDDAYDRYREFEALRRSLARMDRVSAFEVGPSDRLETVVGRVASGGGRRRSGGAPPARSAPDSRAAPRSTAAAGSDPEGTGAGTGAGARADE
ncbi:hypothetical protein K933_00602 [Candidatus Halobonum tyrrellensis G22]|uniref:DUF58 domain-containing protein n=1 Tax=Candidatus Halobonum tyrrellensis G22 TaxID=1324957 RepID=V4J3R1_9EURY|nr:hypothetical protein K933_00602 [Candidatus Halobonum tyrrellensis G22]